MNSKILCMLQLLGFFTGSACFTKTLTRVSVLFDFLVDNQKE